MNNFKYYFLLFILIYLVSLGFFKSQPEALADRVSVYEDLDNEATCYILDERELSCIPNQFLTSK